MKRAAIVIGVNKAGDLPLLADARKSANKLANWLEKKEKFDVVERFIDTDKKKVEIKPVADAIAALIKKRNLAQLVIYFSGHGFLVGDAEMWMLSDAPDFSGEAVNLTASVARARSSGIPHVVFVSDACRSIPEGFQAALVQGSSIFPNPRAASNVETVIDRFFAAKPTEAALELRLGEAVDSFTAIYTKTFLEAFENTPSELVLKREVDGETIEVVPNRRLKVFLRERVAATALARTANAVQRPEAYVECDDASYIGRVLAKLALPLTPRAGKATAKVDWTKTIASASESTAISAVVNSFSAKELSGELLDQFAVSAPKPIKNSAGKWIIRGSDKAARAVKPSQNVRELFETVEDIRNSRKGRIDRLESETGILVQGARIKEVLDLGMRAELLKASGPMGSPSNHDLVRLWPKPAVRGATLLVRFDDGSGIPIAVIQGFIGSITVENGVVADVSYAPSRGSAKWHEYGYGDSKRRAEIEALHAIATAAARQGDFRVRPREAKNFAGRIRVGKGADPTLGLHAAYAYADAGHRAQSHEIWEIMRGDIGIQLYDIALMAGELKGSGVSTFTSRGIHPFCPLLMRGWSMLKAMQARIPKPATDAAEYLHPGLWTTFGPKGMDILFKAVATRRLR